VALDDREHGGQPEVDATLEAHRRQRAVRRATAGLGGDPRSIVFDLEHDEPRGVRCALRGAVGGPHDDAAGSLHRVACVEHEVS